MKLILRITAALVICISTVAAATGTEPVRDAILRIPESMAPMLTEYGKLDMLDYFDSGMDTPTANIVDGQMRITVLSDSAATLSLGNALRIDIYPLPAANDTLWMYIATYTMPVPDSRVIIVKANNDEVTSRVFRAPDFSRWLTPEGKKQRKLIESLVPYISTAYTYCPATGILTLKYSLPASTSSEVSERIAPLLVGNLRYQWTGKKFNLLK